MEFTNDIKVMEEGVARIDSRGGTAMRDAIGMSLDYLKAKGKNHKKVLLVVTDGNDNASGLGLERLVDRARQSEVLVYAIGLLDEEERREAKSARRALNALTHESGGLGFLSQRTGGSGRHRSSGGARNSQSVYDCLFPAQRRSRRKFPADQSYGDRSWPPASPNAYRILRHARYVRRRKP